MRSPTIVKGALCHGLWILTPLPELLHGRRVICHEVVQADVVNAGGVIQLSDTNVVVDGDLVTGHSKKEATDPERQRNPSVHQGNRRSDHRLQQRGNRHARPGPGLEPERPPAPRREGSRKILVVLSEWGYWGEELIGPLDVFSSANYVSTSPPRTAYARRPVGEHGPELP